MAHRAFSSHERTAKHLAPAIRDLLEQAAWSPGSVGTIAVAIGPGSFTGLRIGLMTAKTFAYATGARLVAVDSFDVVAAQCGGPHPRLDIVFDAQRAGLYVRSYRVGGGTAEALDGGSVISIAAWLATCPADGIAGSIRVAGDGVARLPSPWPKPVEPVQAGASIPRAETVGRLGWRNSLHGIFADPWTLLPTYLRPSGAEEAVRANATT